MATTPTIWLDLKPVSVNGLNGDDGRDSHLVPTANGFSVFWTTIDQFVSPDNIARRGFGIDGLGIGPDQEADSFVGAGTGIQDRSEVARDPGLATVLVYRDTFQGATTIWAVKYDANGANPRTYRVAADASADVNPAVAVFADGSFTVAYQAPGSNPKPDLVARHISAAGDVGDKFTIIGGDLSGSPDLQMARLSNGRFLTAYDTDAGGGDLNAVVMSSSLDGSLTSEMVFHTVDATLETEPHVAALAGKFVVVYTRDNGSGDKDVRFGLRTNAGSNVASGVVNTTTTGVQEHPAVTALQDGGFLVIWQDQTKGSTGSVVGQRFDDSGNKVGDEFLVSNFGGATSLSATELDDGRVVVTWTDAFFPTTEYVILDPRGPIYFGTLGNDFIASRREGGTINGRGGNDTIQGFEGQDVINGNASDDTIGGGANVDTLSGNAGIDRLTGGLGRDTMTGGTERDVFDFNAVDETGKTAATRDKILDFVHLVDDIDVSTIDANGAVAGNAKFSFLAANGAAFTGVKGQLHWFQQNPAGTANDKTIVEGDVNGDRVADFAIELKGLIALSAADFIL